MNTRRFFATLAVTSALGAGTFAGAAHAVTADVDNFNLVGGGMGMKATMTWTSFIQDGEPRDLGSFHVNVFNDVVGRCATLTIDWFDGTDPLNPGLAIAHMEKSAGCHTLTTNELTALDMSRANRPRAIKAIVCLTLSGLPAVAPVCVTANAFADNAITGI